MSEALRTEIVHATVVLSRRRKVVFWSIFILIILTISEAGSRLFWVMRGVPFWSAQRMIHRSFYPEIIPVEKASPSQDDDVLDILLLGGSVLNNDFGNIEHQLYGQLTQSGHPVRIYNLAMPGHTSLDSYYKYHHLQNKSFDLVFLYHGINEVRANNCPPAVFRSDYSHYSWYSLTNAWERSANSRWFVGPYTIRFLGSKFLDRLGLGGYVPTHEPRPADMEWGEEIKTATSFQQNFKEIIKLAQSKNERLVLMTFSYNIPPNYSKENYTDGLGLPIEMWGRPKYVAAGIDAHNVIIRELASQYKLALIDQRALISHNPRNFIDICHLTPEGCFRFVQNLLPVILESKTLVDQPNE